MLVEKSVEQRIQALTDADKGANKGPDRRTEKGTKAGPDPSATHDDAETDPADLDAQWAPVDELTHRRVLVPDGSSREQSLNWVIDSAPNEPKDLRGEPRVSVVQRRVISAYSALHGHPHEHDGRIARTERAVRWKIGYRAAFAIVVVVGLLCGSGLAIQRWNSASATGAVPVEQVGAGNDSTQGASSDALSQSESPLGTGPESGEVAGSDQLASQLLDSNAGDGASGSGSSTNSEGATKSGRAANDRAASGSGSAPDSAGAVVLVHVAGAVKKPDVYSFAPGARVAEAISKAGGFTKKADQDALNQARLLVDGEQIYVPKIGEVARLSSDASGSSGGAAESSSATGTAGAGSSRVGVLIDLNTATVADLDTLPGIGPAIAQRIVDFRTQNGPFARTDDVQSVSGIGPAVMSKISDLVTVSGG